MLAVALTVVATLVGLAFGLHVNIADQSMIYLLSILLAALGGRGPGLTAALLAVIGFDVFFLEPRFTFEIAEFRSFATVVLMLVVGTILAELVARLRERERSTAALLAFTRDAAAATDVDGIVRAAEVHVTPVLDRPMSVGLVDGTVAIETIAASEAQRAFVDAIVRQSGVAIDRMRMATTAREAALRANAEELRSTLLSAVSHDLRTPLAVITGMASTLRDAAGPGDREALDTIVGEAQRLSRILLNLLAITKVESGAEPRREWVPLEELVGAALGRLELELAGRVVKVEVAGDVLAHVDPTLADQLLVNLIDNAAKHTPPDAPLEIRARREATAALIEVADRGPGLPAGPADQVFEKFFRGRETSASGVGLGLAVCRAIARAHHGRIEAVPRDGGGAVFRVVIPDAAALPVMELTE